MIGEIVFFFTSFWAENFTQCSVLVCTSSLPYQMSFKYKMSSDNMPPSVPHRKQGQLAYEQLSDFPSCKGFIVKFFGILAEEIPSINLIAFGTWDYFIKAPTH